MKDVVTILKALECMSEHQAEDIVWCGNSCEYFYQKGDLGSIRNGACNYTEMAKDAKELIKTLLGEKMKNHTGNEITNDHEEEAKDNVNHPSHYNFGSIEVIKYIMDKLSPEEFQGYCEGNVLKYVSRWRHKAGLEDLKKAQVYLGWMIESVEEESQKAEN